MAKKSSQKFYIKNCLFEATNIVKDNDKEKYVYRRHGSAFDGKGSWNFNDYFARNVMIFGVGNSSSSYTDNLKNDFLVLGEVDTFGINGSFGAPVKNNNIDFSKAKTNFFLSLHYNSDNSYLYVNRKGIYKFKASDLMIENNI